MYSRIEPMKKVAKNLRCHRDLIFNYFRARKQFSSGVIEGLNNKVKVTMRKAYGFRSLGDTISMCRLSCATLVRHLSLCALRICFDSREFEGGRKGGMNNA